MSSSLSNMLPIVHAIRGRCAAFIAFMHTMPIQDSSILYCCAGMVHQLGHESAVRCCTHAGCGACPPCMRSPPCGGQSAALDVVSCVVWSAMRRIRAEPLSCLIWRPRDTCRTRVRCHTSVPERLSLTRFPERGGCPNTSFEFCMHRHCIACFLIFVEKFTSQQCFGTKFKEKARVTQLTDQRILDTK